MSILKRRTADIGHGQALLQGYLYIRDLLAGSDAAQRGSAVPEPDRCH